MPLKICFASAEVTPFAKAGGLADVSGALLKYLHADGHDVRLVLVDCRALFNRPSLYTADADEHRRFLVLTHAAFICCQRMAFAPQIMHFNDWHTAAGTLLLRAAYAWDNLFHGSRSVLTVHNIGYQGIVSSALHAEVLPGGPVSKLDAGDFAAGRINLLRTGLAYADRITTVSA